MNTNRLAQWLLAGASDEFFCSLQYLRSQKRWPNLDDPRTFNEQIQWMKIHHRDPLLRVCADKVTVRDYVAKKGWSECLIPLVGIYDDPADLSLHRLPARFVLKVSHGSGMNILCRDKSAFDLKEAQRRLLQWMKTDFSKVGREWAYSGLEPKIACEEFLSDPDGEPPWDYKFHCFAGKPRYVQVDYGRFTSHSRALYDTDWQRIPCQLEYSLELRDSPKPQTLERMLEIARALSSPFPYSRIDLYELADRVFFGEITFYPGKGVERFSPRKFDSIFGRWLRVRSGQMLANPDCREFGHESS